MTFNFAFYLSLVLAAFGCTGLILAGKGKWYGWGVGLAVQPVWATYAIVTKGYGLLITCLMYGFVNARNLWKWRQEKLLDDVMAKIPDHVWTDDGLGWKPSEESAHFEKFWNSQISSNSTVGYVESIEEDETGLKVTWVQANPSLKDDGRDGFPRKKGWLEK